MEPDLSAMARRLAAVDGVLGVCLGGSRARGTHRPDSDHDLGLYYRPPLDTGALRELAAEITGRPVEVTEPGDWGRWVDGGAWLDSEGSRIDWLYRDLDRVRHYWRECRAGRFELGVQAGHPLGVYSHSYVGELALGRILADPTGALTGLRDELAHYPGPLGDALVANARWEVPFTLAAARKGAARGDAYYLHGCLFRVVGLLTQALHARAGRWLLNEKGAVDASGLLPGAPPQFAPRAHALFGLDPVSAVAAAEELAAEIL
ncbi:nucleotidyltransferase domain-containing protein [Kitasatospora sp. NBC_00374]|uniref:nucleotidyltransferase domain-containing protein n=1 Tax=Kitasatospora sp. NBC_00374 TaxID=2975964 RepID=UPI0030E1F1A7